MPLFAYKVRTPTGAVTDGTMEAAEQRLVVDKLRNQKLVVLEIGEKKAGFKNPLEKYLQPKIGQKDLVLFSRQFSTLVGAGVPLVQGLGILVEQAENPTFKKVLVGVRDDIEQGVSIAEAMGTHPTAFSELYVNMVRAGEVGGILDAILERLSGYLEAAEALRAKVKGAMMYPIVVLSIATGVTIFLLAVIIPKFAVIFESFGGELPLPTKILIGISNFLRHYVLLLIPVGIGIKMGFGRLVKTEKGRLMVDRKVLNLPVFGALLRKVAVAKFTRTFGTLIKSGVPIIQALETVAKTSGNKVIENAINHVRDVVQQGEKLATPLRESKVFPNMVVQMISVGEETGNLDVMLAKIADFYDAEVNTAVEGLTSMIEPLVIVFMGLVIGAIVIAMFMPMFELGTLASKAG